MLYIIVWNSNCLRDSSQFFNFIYSDVARDSGEDNDLVLGMCVHAFQDKMMINYVHGLI